MTEIEIELLENLFDSLDKLFDRKCTVFDLTSELQTTQSRLGLNPPIDLNPYLEKLNKLIKSEESEEAKRNEALAITNKLREQLNDLLPI
ncbi:hypothetical protein P3339_09660 [Microbulbifer sp. MLAF003]|uniref:hypothetical protein n=1 Tax=unclassified Microbulbifer TaxID=2619833 RepID=UPI0024ACD9F5|nr:hypothetical protein [Microbulbifer sp. MLAF003]WHI53006.1 hypothetical protein P3339_09660 [Microbulbifer sp. MLAF003]